MKWITTAVVATTLFAGPAFAAKWKIDGSHSSAAFKVRHMMISNARGEFTGITGAVEFDPKSPTKGTVDVAIDVSTVDTRDPKRDGHLKSADFFDVEKHPTMTFKSKKITKAGNKLKVLGTLTIRGKSKDVTLDTEMSKPVTSPWGQTVVGVTATTTINRQDFGVSWNKNLDKGGVVVGDDVNIEINLELIQDDGKSS